MRRRTGNKGSDPNFHSAARGQLALRRKLGSDPFFLWLEPHIELAQNHGFSARELRFLVRLIRANADVIKAAWHEHFDH